MHQTYDLTFPRELGSQQRQSETWQLEDFENPDHITDSHVFRRTVCVHPQAIAGTNGLRTWFLPLGKRETKGGRCKPSQLVQ